MKKIVFLAALFIFAGVSFGQVSGSGFLQPVNNAPSGTCSSASLPWQAVRGVGTIYYCNGTPGTWTQVSGGGGGGGANTALSNLSGVSINANLVPQSNKAVGTYAAPFGQANVGVVGTTLNATTQTYFGDSGSLTDTRIAGLTTSSGRSSAFNAVLGVAENDDATGLEATGGYFVASSFGNTASSYEIFGSQGVAIAAPQSGQTQNASVGVAGYAEMDGLGTDNVLASFKAAGNACNSGACLGSYGYWARDQGPSGASVNAGVWVDDQTAGSYAIHTGAGPVVLGGPITAPSGCTGCAVHAIGATFDGAGSALTTSAKTYITVPYGCTIQAWNATVDTGTITFDVWKIATGTAIPTISNTITASAKPAIASGTALHSTTLTGWTTSVVANDIFAFTVNTVSGATKASIALQCQ